MPGLPAWVARRPRDRFGPAEGDDTFPITLTYRLDARVTSFDDAPFGPATTISIGPRPNPP